MRNPFRHVHQWENTWEDDMVWRFVGDSTLWKAPRTVYRCKAGKWFGHCREMGYSA